MKKIILFLAMMIPLVLIGQVYHEFRNSEIGYADIFTYNPEPTMLGDIITTTVSELPYDIYDITLSYPSNDLYGSTETSKFLVGNPYDISRENGVTMYHYVGYKPLYESYEIITNFPIRKATRGDGGMLMLFDLEGDDGTTVILYLK